MAAMIVQRARSIPIGPLSLVGQFQVRGVLADLLHLYLLQRLEIRELRAELRELRRLVRPA